MGDEIMPRVEIELRLTKLAALIAELEAMQAAGDQTPGLQGRLRFLRKRQQWYADRRYGVHTRPKVYSLRQPVKPAPVDVPPDLLG